MFIGLAGLSIAYALQLTFVFNMLVRQSAEVETQLVSVERVVEYTQLPNEAAYINSANRYEREKFKGNGENNKRHFAAHPITGHKTELFQYEIFSYGIALAWIWC